ncbi:MAG TPA: cupredoxin family copper-binding protein [Mycobacteriales bacterium]|nr:cupredoxin family copper-binding protein [Mycobacteriales bacterium]
MLRIRRALVPMACVLLSVALAGCGGSSSGGGLTPGDNSPSTVSGKPIVTISGFAFHPSTLTVKAGTKVTFVQQDAVPHDVAGSGTSAFIHSPTLMKGQSYTVTFSKPGTYNYICSIHPRMQAKVIVQ